MFFLLLMSKVFYCFTESYRSQSFIWVMAPDTYVRHVQQVLEQHNFHYQGMLGWTFFEICTVKICAVWELKLFSAAAFSVSSRLGGGSKWTPLVFTYYRAMLYLFRYKSNLVHNKSSYSVVSGIFFRKSALFLNVIIMIIGHKKVIFVSLHESAVMKGNYPLCNKIKYNSINHFLCLAFE